MVRAQKADGESLAVDTGKCFGMGDGVDFGLGSRGSFTESYGAIFG